MNDEMLQTAYGRLLAERGADRAECSTPEALRAVVEGTADEAERLRILRHVGRCRHCRTELDLLRAAGDAARLAARPAWRVAPVWAAAAAALVVLVGGAVAWQAVRGRSPDAPGVLRDDGAAAVRLLAPDDEGEARLPVTLVWGAVPNARRYEVEVLRPDGAPVFTATTADTAVVVPAAAGLASGVAYRWWVAAALPDGSQPRSLARRLRIAP